MNLFLKLQLSLWPFKKEMLPGPKRNKHSPAMDTPQSVEQNLQVAIHGLTNHLKLVVRRHWDEPESRLKFLEWQSRGRCRASIPYHHTLPKELNEEVLGLGNTSNIHMPDAPVPLQVARNSLWPQNCDPALWAADSGWGSPRKTWTSVATCTWNTWVASNLAPWCSIFFHIRMSHNPSPNIHDKIA